MVSSTVYGIEDLLDQLYALLDKFGYDVVMSHKGTIAVNSTEHAFESSLKAVEKCDLFVGLIMPHYGSGVIPGQLSITHQEMRRAIEINKPRWFLAHEFVVFARLLMRGSGFKTSDARAKIAFTGAGALDDLRVIDMYEAATLQDKAFQERQGNWVQKVHSAEDALLFASAQFHRYAEIEEFLRDHLGDPDTVKASVEAKSGGK
ncbi:DUF4062 domain-containing protein [Sphingomonas glacialis]|uniref:DUF4062 domain-containing protein n=2 Tax=Sphingomonas glacialis TaxID=658225 RepID=A0A502G0D0_9SPHN|nr:DUF4062 domain-containing protein [Sphingomonas glacialis]